MRCRTLIKVYDVSGLTLETIYRSLKPEEELKAKSIRMKVIKSSNSLIISIDAKDLNSVRAVVNSTLRMMKLVNDAINFLTPSPP